MGTDFGIHYIILPLSGLRELDIIGSESLNCEGIVIIANNCPLLESLNISGCIQKMGDLYFVLARTLFFD